MRCIYVNCFNILRIFYSGQHKIEKCFFQQFKDYNSGREHENYTKLHFSALPACNIHFWIWKYLKLNFQILYFGHFWSVKYLNFSPKATDLDSSTFHCNSISSHQFRTWANFELSFWIHGEISKVNGENFISFHQRLLFWWQRNSF